MDKLHCSFFARIFVAFCFCIILITHKIVHNVMFCCHDIKNKIKTYCYFLEVGIRWYINIITILEFYNVCLTVFFQFL